MSNLFWYPGHELLLTDIVRAENCYVYDSRGNKYIDLESGVWCTCLGQGHPRIRRVMAEQSGRIAHTGFNYTSGVVAAAADEILSLLGFTGGRCVFLCSGSEAVEYGVRLAQLLSEGPLLMTMADSYFGAYGSASKKLADEWFLFDWFPCADCSESGDCNEHCEAWAAIPFDRIGGFLLEPGSSSGLVRFPPEKLIRNIVEAVRKKSGLVMINEVTTGIGQTGQWFGFQHYGLEPDIVALGKGIGNGYPVSVTAFAPRVIERLGEREVMYAQSHQNDPLGAAVAREVVRTMHEERLSERGRELADLLLGGLREIAARTDRIKEVRGRGLLAAVELVDDAASSLTIQVHHELLRRGFIVGRRPGVSVLRLDPSLTIERQDLKSFLMVLDDVLAGQDTREDSHERWSG